MISVVATGPSQFHAFMLLSDVRNFHSKNLSHFVDCILVNSVSFALFSTDNIPIVVIVIPKN